MIQFEILHLEKKDFFNISFSSLGTVGFYMVESTVVSSGLSLRILVTHWVSIYWQQLLDTNKCNFCDQFVC